jgi:hypothetical protein
MSSGAQSDAAQSAADAQMNSTNTSIAAQQAQFAAMKELLKPYADAGVGSLKAQQDMLGLNGNDAQAAAMNSLQNSSQFSALAKQGEGAILQNASATGGLRGGNVQGALAQFRPALLSQMINDQYSRLGGITSIGQNAAAMSGNAGMQSANSISALLQQQGASQAGLALAQGQSQAGMWNTLGGAVGTFAGMGGFGSTAAPASTVAGFGGSGLGGGITGSMF